MASSIHPLGLWLSSVGLGLHPCKSNPKSFVCGVSTSLPNLNFRILRLIAVRFVREVVWLSAKHV